MTTKIIWWHDAEVEVHFTFTKGCPDTFNDPGYDDEWEIEKIMYQGVDVSPLIDCDAVVDKLIDEMERSRRDDSY